MRHDVIHGLLRLGCGPEDCPIVFLQGLQPAVDIGGALVEFRLKAKLGAKHAVADFGHQLFERMGLEDQVRGPIRPAPGVSAIAGTAQSERRLIKRWNQAILSSDCMPFGEWRQQNTFGVSAMNDFVRSHEDVFPARLIYALYVIGLVVLFTSIGGLIYAYLSRGKNAMLDTHLTHQIRTFWIFFGLNCLGLLTIIVMGLGFLILFFSLVWFLARVVSGFMLANDNKPITGTKNLGMLAY